MPDFGQTEVIQGYSKPTSLQFIVLEDGTQILITSQQKGPITFWKIESEGEGTTRTYTETLLFQTNIIEDIPNYDDKGVLQPNQNDRQITGLFAELDANGEIVVYVTSSTADIGGGGGSTVNDKGLDTNSGVLSKLTIDINDNPDGTGWSADKVDLIRGLPRSEENHSVNGMDMTPDGNLLMMIGGFTNAGAPGQNFAYTPEYWLSGTLVEVDLSDIEARIANGETFDDGFGNTVVYDLPSLGIDRDGFTKNSNNPFGGNDGYNQTYLTADSPLDIFATGFRNAYDVQVVEIDVTDPRYDSTPGADNFLVYTWDNGANGSWGEPTANLEGHTYSVNVFSGDNGNQSLAVWVDGTPNKVIVQPDGSIFVVQDGMTGVIIDVNGVETFLESSRPDNTPLLEDTIPLSPQSQDNLHLVQRGEYYGSPNISQVNPDAVIYLKPEIETDEDNIDSNAIVAPQFATMSLRDYLPPELNGDPLKGYVVSEDGYFFLKPKKGGGNYDGALAVNGGSTNGIVIFEYIEGVHPVELEELDGDLFATGFNSKVIYVDLSEDGTEALNRDDIENGVSFQNVTNSSNPLDITIAPDGSIWYASHGANNISAFVPGGTPLVDDSDDDDDDLSDNTDPFQYDANNGLGIESLVSSGEVFEFTFENEIASPNGLLGAFQGLTGHMLDFGQEYFSVTSDVQLENLLNGGVAGRLQVEAPSVSSGSAEGSANSLTYALQSGINYDPTATKLLIESFILNPWQSTNQEAGQNTGIYFGTGTQADYVMARFAINANGDEVVQIVIETNDTEPSIVEIPAPGFTDELKSPMLMRMVIDTDNMTVQAFWAYETMTGPVSGNSAAIQIDPTGTGNSITEAVDLANEGGFDARGIPIDGQPGDVINQFIGPVKLGLAVGLAGSLGVGNSQTAPAFTPEYDNLLISASNDQGQFAPDARNEDGGAVTVGETQIFEVAELLANDRDLEGGTVSISSVAAIGDATVELISGGTQISYTPNDLNASGFNYEVSNGTLSTTAEVDVLSLPPEGSVIYRVNAGSGTVTAIDGGPDWIGDTTTEGEGFIASTSESNPYTQAQTNAEGEMDLTFLENQADIPWQLFTHERGDDPTPGNLQYAFDVTEGQTYAVTLYYVENWNGIFGSNVPRVFDVAVNGTVPAQFDDINPVQEAADALGQELPAASASNADKQPFLGTAFSKTVIVTADSAELLLEFLPGTQNPKVNAIEIALVSGDPVDPGPEVSIADATVTEGGDLVFELTTSEPASEAITINYEIVPGTAEAGIHYTLSGATPDANGVITGSLLIDSSSDGSITLNTVDDAAFNLARDLTVNITGVTGDNATIATGQGTASGTIENDDLALPEPGEVLFAINAGGSAPVDGTAYGLPGVTFETDTQAANNANLDLTGATTGNMGTGNNTNTNGADDTFVNPDGTPYVGDTTLFESERWTNNFGYNFDVPNGDYVVDLYFAETFVSLGDNTGGVGTRKFDVAIEGGTVLDDLDLFDEGDGTAGDGEGLPLVPIIRTFEVTVTDGVLDIDLNSLAANGGADNAKISAIVVKAAGGDPIPATISIAAPADAEETGDNGFTTLDFDVSFDFAPSEAATVSYSVSVNGTETVASADLDLGTTGGVISVDVANDELDNGADSVVVTLLSTTASADVAVLDTVVAATASVTEDDSVLVPTPTDIDGDGVLNGDDPFADDGDNGDAKVLVAGGEFVQDFNTDSSDPFSAETGFTGILVNPDFDAPGASETDPYGDRTTDGNGTTSGGFLSVTSSNEDSFGPTGAAQNPIAANNIIKDNYQSAVDVTGTDSFEIVANAKNPWFGGTAPTSFASFGITVGAGGVDDWVKLVFGGSNQGPRIELADQGSLNGDNNSITVASQLPDLDVTTIADIEFQIVIDKTAGTNGQLTGFVTFFDDDGSSLGTVTTPVRDITSGGSLEASIDGQNPLTGGDGGLAYGISITDYNGGADPQSTPSFTAEYDSLTIRSLDAAVADALVSIADAPTVVESGDAGTTTLAFDISADDGFTGDLDVAYTLDTGDGSVALTQTVSLTAGAGMLTADIDNDDVDDGAETATVVLTGITTVGYTVDTVAATATGTVNEDEFNVPVDEAVDGDLSDDNLAPTDVKIGLGDNVITAGQQGIVDPDDRDFFTITVAEGQVLDAIILQDFQTTEEEGLPNLAFIALKEGATFDSDIDALEAQAASPIAEGLLGGATYGTGNIGFDILASMNTTDFVGFSLPLQAGTYSFWLNQNGPESTATLNFQVSSIGEVSIGDAGEVVESGDDATSTTIIFPITSTPAREGSLGLVAEINVDGVVQTTNANVTVDASGTGSLAITLPNDDVDDGADAVTVTITSVNSTVYTLGAQATGTATITEDDAIDTSDLDEDGVVNALDPAYLDATNGLSNVLEAGQTIGVEFNEAGPVDPLSEGTGLSGVNVNPDGTGTGDDVDPYLGATDASGKIENGLLSVTATDGDSFNDNNASQNDYGFMLNTSDTDSFTVTSKIVAPDGGIPAVKFAAFGIQIGDGTQESYIKVARASIGDGNPIIDIRWDNDDAHQDANPANTGTGGGALSQAITLDATQAAAPAYILSMDIDRSDPANITVTPRIQPVDAAGVPVGAEIVAQTFVVTGDIAAAINGMNPSTGPNGGGLFVGAYSTSFNDAEDFTASWDYLRVTSNDTPADTVAPTASIVGSAVYYAETSVGVQVRFTDDTLLDASSITADGLVVTVNGVEYSADFVSTTVLTDRLIDARFNFPEPDGGWPIGPFDIVLNDGAVLDAAGNPSAEVLGSGVIEPQTYVGFNQDLIEVVEGGNTDSTSVQFEILITPPAAQDLLVSYAWSVNGGEEQTVSSETVSFDENGVGIVTVFIENDDVDNGPDDVDIRLTGLGGRLGLRFEPFASSATATVTEDDAPILVSISDAPLLIEQGDTGVSLLGFPLALSVAEEATLDLIVEYAINGGEVQSVTLNGVVFDTAGMAAAVIEVQNDNLDDGSETVSVELISVTTVGYEVDGDNNTATGTVTEDDAIPSVASPIEAQAADEDAAFSFTIPDGTFADEDGEAALTLAATLDDDSALPSWLAFDAETKTFSGTPENGDVGAISIKLTATDEAGQSVETNFDLTVNNTNDAPVVTVFQQELDATSGIETVFSIAGLVEVTDEDVGDSVTLTVRPTEPDILVENGNIIVPASFSEPFFEVDFIATDSSGVSGFGTIVVNLTEAPDVTPPVGTFTSTVSVTPGQPLVIEVTYSDDREVDASTFGADDVTVTDPVGGDVTPTDFSIDGNVVTYTFTPPTGGWTA
ncbi:MAG: malectin domain-containing carbohydrate-binding protein, partial [Pseudomonadota bacterium]